MLDGPAGDHLYGRLDDLEGPQDVARRMQQEGAGAVYQDALGATTSGVGEAVFPYLPADPQELLRMYLEVVGVRAADCYGAQVTVHSAQELIGRVLGEGATNVGPKQPCADGKDRGRIHGAEHVVVTYRDSAAYAEGRARWAAYQKEVLLAHLERGTGIREAVWVDDDRDIDNGLLRAGAALTTGSRPNRHARRGPAAATVPVLLAPDRLTGGGPQPSRSWCRQSAAGLWSQMSWSAAIIWRSTHRFMIRTTMAE